MDRLLTGWRTSGDPFFDNAIDTGVLAAGQSLSRVGGHRWAELVRKIEPTAVEGADRSGDAAVANETRIATVDELLKQLRL